MLCRCSRNESITWSWCWDAVNSGEDQGDEVSVVSRSPGVAPSLWSTITTAGYVERAQRWVSLVQGGVEEAAMTTIRRTVALLTLACIGVPLTGSPAANAATAPPAPGYWLAAADGGIFSFGAPFYGSGAIPTGTCGFTPQPPSTLNASFGCGAIAATPSGNGYWLVNAYRWVTAFGHAGEPAQVGCTSLNGAMGSWAGIASSPTGDGFFLASSDGAVVGCGDAGPFVGVTSKTLNAPVVGIAATRDGRGYWLVASDGGVFAYGDATFHGSMGGTHLNAPVVGIAATRDGRGYWLVASDGGVFSFGDAQFEGSMGATPTECTDGGDRRHTGWQGILARWGGRRGVLVRRCSI